MAKENNAYDIKRKGIYTAFEGLTLVFYFK